MQAMNKVMSGFSVREAVLYMCKVSNTQLCFDKAVVYLAN